MSSNPPQDVVS